MSFFKNYWDKVKEALSPTDILTPHEGKNLEPEIHEDPWEDLEEFPPYSGQLQNAQDVLNIFKENDTTIQDPDTALGNLQAIKDILNNPKEDMPEDRFNKIKDLLGEPECHETVRQERWHKHMHCINCQSTRLHRIIQLPPSSPYNQRYRCLECGEEFNDDTGTPFEGSPIPLSTWMQCWYLLGCTDSLIYIASKLGLDLFVVEKMIRELQKFFNANQPLTRYIGFGEWSKQSDRLKTHLRDELHKSLERFDANVTYAPKDTGEFRRQQMLRRTNDPTLIIDPTHAVNPHKPKPRRN